MRKKIKNGIRYAFEINRTWLYFKCIPYKF